ncbi:MAG: 30S ribosomal protein S16 [Puniceicoccaceae bacterium MED-G32]|jgi:small subunit ribosomal protein S16|nr:MAG: 30S ribosomal protein S16 [Puniceicoccaceae bacterium MED-G32]|tara:strand:+ start:9340 stop:9807 length:468 start_codon:yes stop_codon:yes gene_type:complete
MALKIRLQRHGTSHRPFYRMVVTEANARRDGRFVELLGTYEPQASRPENELNLKIDRVEYWKSVGAKTTDTAESLLRRARREIDGVIPKEKSKKEEKQIEQAVVAEEAAEPIVEAEEAEAVAEETTEACSLPEAETVEAEAEETEASAEEASKES